MSETEKNCGKESGNKKYPYLDLIKRPLDNDQSDVCFTTENAVVAAGAGSGKTQVLATRFAWLVMSKNIDASQILTLTFTDKAASEMYKRIYDTLSFFANYKKGAEPEKAEAEADLTEEKVARAKKALRDFSNSHIQTLDSYCGQIVRQCANRYGLTPDFSTGSAQSERSIKNEAFKFILKNKESPAVKTFANPGSLQEFAEKTFAETIINNTTIATEKGYFINKLAKQRAEIIAVWNYLVTGEKTAGYEKLLEKNFKPALYYVNEAEPVLEEAKVTEKTRLYAETCRKIFSEAWNLQENGKIEDWENVGNLELAENGDFDRSDRLRTVNLNHQMDSVLEKVQQTQNLVNLVNNLPTTKGFIKDLRSLLTTDNGASLKSDSLKFLNLCNTFISQYDAIKSLNLLLDNFTQQINASKRRTGSLTFADVPSLALKILLENEDIRNQEEKAYSKIMIDEFQDNNGKNRDLLYLLALEPGQLEGRIATDENNPSSLHDKIISRDENGNIIEDLRNKEKLFFVGDEKQSIYKFRGADVTVFNELTDSDSHKAENRLLSMTFNYRSAPELLTSFNLIFKNGNGIFKEPDEDKKYEADYKKEAKKNGEELPALTKENVRLHFCFSSDKKIKQNENLLLEDRIDYVPQKEMDAYFIAKKILELSENEKDKNGNINWSAFAILDRSRTDRRILTKYLSMFKIPFNVDQFSNIFEDAVVNDFYNFLRICVYPSDINAFAAFLCSPFAGLTENEAETVLSCLVDIKQKDFVFDPLRTENVDENLKNELSPESFGKFLSAREFYAQNRKKVLRQRITETLSELWNNRGYKYETMLDEQKLLCAEHFDMLFELARQVDENEKSVAWFIDELASQKSGGFESDSDVDTKSVSYPLERSSAVQIMTIHKSKGLQFDHVFVWGCTNYTSKGEKSLVFFDDENGVSVKVDGSGSNYFYEKQKELSKLKDLAEFRRLIYVAITRAVKDVFVIGDWHYSEKLEENLKKEESINKLLERMVLKNYPEFLEDGFASEKPVFNSSNSECGFDYFSIPEVTYDDLIKKDDEPADSKRERVISKLESAQVSDNLIKTEIHSIKRASPSHLEDKAAQQNSSLQVAQHDSSSQFAQQDSSLRAKRSNPAAQFFETDKFPELSEILKKYSGQDSDSEEENLPLGLENSDEKTETLSSESFQAADFGTLVHDYLNKMCLGIDVKTYIPNPGLFKNLDEKDAQKIREICIKMCGDFASSLFFEEFLDAKKSGRLAETELEFKYFDGNILYHGSIDLIYETEDKNYVILDYKTDREIRPEKHYLQQKCYKKAAEDLVPEDGNFKCFLYYLRFGKSVEITENTAD